MPPKEILNVILSETASGVLKPVRCRKVQLTNFDLPGICHARFLGEILFVAIHSCV